MSDLSDELRRRGFVPTGETSPVDEDGRVWSKGVELVCDKTAVVIDGNHHSTEEKENCSREVYRYQNSERVKMPGGYIGSYSWGHDGDDFSY